MQPPCSKRKGTYLADCAGSHPLPRPSPNLKSHLHAPWREPLPCTHDQLFPGGPAKAGRKKKPIIREWKRNRDSALIGQEGNKGRPGHFESRQVMAVID